MIPSSSSRQAAEVVETASLLLRRRLLAVLGSNRDRAVPRNAQGPYELTENEKHRSVAE